MGFTKFYWFLDQLLGQNVAPANVDWPETMLSLSTAGTFHMPRISLARGGQALLYDKQH